MILVLNPIMTVMGCAATNSGSSVSPQRDTTMLRSVDLIRMTEQMATSLVNSGVDFTQPSPFIIVTDRVVNRTNHLMEPGEKEHFLVRLRSLLNQNESLRDFGVVFIAQPNEVNSLQSDLGDENESNQAERFGPSHALTATFRTLTAIDRTRREDTYECTFQLQSIGSRLVIWEDGYQVRYNVQRSRTQ